LGFADPRVEPSQKDPQSGSMQNGNNYRFANELFSIFFFYSRRQPQNFKRNFLALSSLINVGRRPKGVHYSMFCCGCRRCYHCFICSDFNLGTQRTQDDLGHGISGGNGGGGGGARRRQWAWCLMGNNHSMGMEIRILLGRH